MRFALFQCFTNIVRVASHKKVLKIAKRKSLPKTQPLGDEGKRIAMQKMCDWNGNPAHTPRVQSLRPLSHPGRYVFERHFFNS